MTGLDNSWITTEYHSRQETLSYKTTTKRMSTDKTNKAATNTVKESNALLPAISNDSDDQSRQTENASVQVIQQYLQESIEKQKLILENVANLERRFLRQKEIIQSLNEKIEELRTENENLAECLRQVTNNSE